MAWHTSVHGSIAATATAGFLLAASPADAQTSPQGKTKAAARASAAANDARVIELQQRIEVLEQKLNALLQAAGAQAVATNPAPGASAPQRAAQAAPSAPAPSAASAPRSGASTARSSAPGSFEVDEAAAQRALERTLTQTGALLLPAGTIELTPSFNYSRTESASVLVGTGADIGITPRRRQNEFSPRLDLRAGMTRGLQLEASLPYNYVRNTDVSGVGTASRDSGHGIGDVTVGVAKTLLQEKGWHPDLIGRISYNFGNGKREDGDIVLNGGFRQLSAELVALKRQDPLAFTASIGYGKAFEEDSIHPGDVATFSLGTLLAASPATSLQLGFTQIYREEQKFNGARIRGSDQTYGIINLGASSVLSRDVTLVTQFGIGLGDDAPKYSVSVALPILFR